MTNFREHLDTLMGLSWEVGRIDGISEVGQPSDALKDKRDKAFGISEEHRDNLLALIVKEIADASKK